jgi:hypothetical protein
MERTIVLALLLLLATTSTLRAEPANYAGQANAASQAGGDGFFWVPAFRVGPQWDSGLGSGFAFDTNFYPGPLELGISLVSSWGAYGGGGTGLFTPALRLGYAAEHWTVGARIGFWLSQNFTGIALDPWLDDDGWDDGEGWDVVIGPSIGITGKYRFKNHPFWGFQGDIDVWDEVYHLRGAVLMGPFTVNFAYLFQEGDPLFFIYPGICFDAWSFDW